jgi:hypothetical protein
MSPRALTARFGVGEPSDLCGTSIASLTALILATHGGKKRGSLEASERATDPAGLPSMLAGEEVPKARGEEEPVSKVRPGSACARGDSRGFAPISLAPVEPKAAATRAGVPFAGEDPGKKRGEDVAAAVAGTSSTSIESDMSVVELAQLRTRRNASMKDASRTRYMCLGTLNFESISTESLTTPASVRPYCRIER